MGKRKTISPLFLNVAISSIAQDDIVSNITPVEYMKDSDLNDITFVTIDDPMKTMPGQELRMTKENIEKVEKFEAINNENGKLFEENGHLQELLSKYIVKLEESETAVNAFKQLLKQLLEENNKLLLDVSRLTFENARYKSELKKMSENSMKTMTPEIQLNCSHTYMQSRQKSLMNSILNGYSSWN